MGSATAPDTAENGNPTGENREETKVGGEQAPPAEEAPKDAGGAKDDTTAPTANEPPPEQPPPKTPPKASPAPPPSAAAGAAGAASSTSAGTPGNGPQQNTPPRAVEPLPSCHYEALGIQSSATDEDIKKAFKTMSMKEHPDKNNGCSNAKERFQRILEAKSILLDKTKRASYDAEIFTKGLMAYLGVASNIQVQQWVEGSLRMAPGAIVEKVVVERQLTDTLPQHFTMLTQQCGARFFSMHSPRQGVVLIGGVPAAVRKGEECLRTLCKEMNGQQAPSDGLVFVIPPDQMHKLSMMNLPQLLHQWTWTFGSSLHAVRDRVVIRGGKNWAAVVASLQGLVDFRGITLNSTGHELDCWRFAHMSECQGFQGLHLLPQNRDPDATAARRLLQYVLQLDQHSKLSLVEMAQRVLKQRLTTVSVRVASCQVVYDEYNRIGPKQGAPLVCQIVTFLGQISQVSQFLHQRFRTDINVQALQRLESALTSSNGIVLRSKAYTAAREAVPDDKQWHSWEDVLKPNGRLQKFWSELRDTVVDKTNRQLMIPKPPMEWYTVPEIMFRVLKPCVQPPILCVDAEKGLFRDKEPEAPPPVAVGRAQPAVPVLAADPDHPVTSVEQAEDVIWELSQQRDAAAYLELGMVTQQLQRSTGDTSADKFSKKWFEQYKLSFDMKKSSSNHHVKLTSAGKKRAEVRAKHRQRKQEQADELAAARRYIGQILESGVLPDILQEKELCSVLILLGSETNNVPRGLPNKIVSKICGRNTKFNELLNSIQPFNMSMVMRAVVRLKSRGNFNEEQQVSETALVAIMRAASLEMHDKEGSRMWAPLTVVKECVLAAAQEPFKHLFFKRQDMDEKVLAASTALRIHLELAVEQSLPNLCPPCLSSSYGNFRIFAELCAALANLYGMVAHVLSKEHTDNVEQAFTKLATSVENFSKSLNSKDSRGLCRLAFAFASIGQEKSDKLATSSRKGLTQLSKVLSTSFQYEADGWDLAQLTEIACSYKSCADEQLFKLLGEASASRATTGLKRESAVRLMGGFHQVGHLKLLESFLKRLYSSDWFRKNLLDAPEKDMPILLGCMVHAQDYQAIEDVETNYIKKVGRGDLTLSTFIGMLKEVHGASNPKARSLSIVLQNKIGDVMAKSRTIPDDLEGFVKVCEDTRARSKLVELLSHKDRLLKIPKVNNTGAWSEFNNRLGSTLGVLRNGDLRAPRLEAAFAGRMMKGLEQCGVFQQPPKQPDADFVKPLLTAALYFSEDALASLPALVHNIIEALTNSPLPSGEELEKLKTLLKNMLRVGASVAGDKDEALDQWSMQIEDAILAKAGTKTQMSWGQVEMTFPAADEDSKKLQHDLREALGPSWLSLMLARSRRLSWRGSEVHIDAPRPRAALHRLVEKAKDVLPEKLKSQVRALQAEAPAAVPAKSPAPRPPRGSPADRSRSPVKVPPAGGSVVPPEARPKAKVKGGTLTLTVVGCTDPGLAKCLEGQYERDGVHHKKARFRKISPELDGSVDNIWLYYWDPEVAVAGDKEDQGWWFGAEVGGETAVMHNPGGYGNYPPRDGWDLGLKIHPPATGPRPGGTVGAANAKGKAKPKPKPGARPGGGPPAATPAKRAREENDERHAELRKWLLALDNNKGQMLNQYFEALVSEFDGDLHQIGAARIETNSAASPIEQVEPTFWDAIKCEKGLDKTRFAKAIIALPA